VNLEELSFFNRQLAGMVASGIPLEGALKHLCSEMAKGKLRSEIEALEAQLREGAPLAEAIGCRSLPPLYVSMVRLAATSGDLPAVLTMLADHYEQEAVAWTKLRGLMVYPHIVLTVALAFSVMMTRVLHRYLDEVIGYYSVMRWSVSDLVRYKAELYVPPVALGVLLAVALLAGVFPGWRRWLRWRAPAFKDASMARVASAMSVMLRSGCTLEETFAAVADLEAGTPAAPEIERWRERHGEGHGAFSEIAAGSVVFPPFFVWIASTAGEDLASGFERAGGVYTRRARHRTEMMLYAALPLAVLVIGLVILGEAWVFAKVLTALWRPL